MKFRINFTSVRLNRHEIARGEAECYLQFNLTELRSLAGSPIKYVSDFHYLDLIVSRSLGLLAKYSKISIELPLTKMLNDLKSLNKQYGSVPLSYFTS